MLEDANNGHKATGGNDQTPSGALSAAVRFSEAGKVHSNDDNISRHRFAPYNAYCLTVNYSRRFLIAVQLKHTF